MITSHEDASWDIGNQELESYIDCCQQFTEVEEGHEWLRQDLHFDE